MYENCSGFGREVWLVVPVRRGTADKIVKKNSRNSALNFLGRWSAVAAPTPQWLTESRSTGAASDSDNVGILPIHQMRPTLGAQALSSSVT